MKNKPHDNSECRCKPCRVWVVAAEIGKMNADATYIPIVKAEDALLFHEEVNKLLDREFFSYIIQVPKPLEFIQLDIII